VSVKAAIAALREFVIEKNRQHARRYLATRRRFTLAANRKITGAYKPVISGGFDSG
jgi:hypothetical protein